ncbi:MAG: hypothetical protein JWM11_374 [Planctomycetaceae bacterium]|nr:hypothetical protein [Planctomycetaceae bacterium]
MLNWDLKVRRYDFSPGIIRTSVLDRNQTATASQIRSTAHFITWGFGDEHLAGSSEGRMLERERQNDEYQNNRSGTRDRFFKIADVNEMMSRLVPAIEIDSLENSGKIRISHFRYRL